jgi:hypothetical protein
MGFVFGSAGRLDEREDDEEVGRKPAYDLANLQGLLCDDDIVLPGPGQNLPLCLNFGSKHRLNYA